VFIVSGGEDALRAGANWPSAIGTAVDTYLPPGETGYERPAFVECRVDAPTAAISVDVSRRSFVEHWTEPPLAFVQPSRDHLGTDRLEVRAEHIHCVSAQERVEQFLVVSRHPSSPSDRDFNFMTR
jgi:hypothetical protein